MKPRLFTPLFLVWALLLVPLNAGEIEGLPAPGEPRHTTLTPPQDKTLTNGLRVILVERPGLPLLSAELILKSGAETDPPKRAGLAQFTAALLKRGTTTRSATQLATDIEALGAKIDTEATWDATSLKLITLSANAAPALDILAELAQKPAFAQDELDRQRRELLDDLRLSLEEPGTVGKLAAARAALGASPYAHPAQGTPASLARLTRKDVTAHHFRIFRPANAILVLAGQIAADEAFALAEKTFGGWTAADEKAAQPAAATPPNSPRIILVNMPNAGQAAVVLAAPSIPRDAGDWFVGKVTNTLLGGGYSSRLNQEIRLKRGLSYGAGSSLSTRRSSGLFLASAQTKNESATEVVKVMQAEIARLLTEPVPADYLNSRQSVLTGAFARSLETNAGYVEHLGELALYSLPLDGLAQYIERVDQVGPTALQTFAEQHLPSDKFSIVVVGRAKTIEPTLRIAFPKLEVIPASRLDLETPALRAAGNP